jgi:putative transposase
MNFKPGHIYHLYNRTFNKTLAFPTRANYLFFTDKLASLRPLADILCYCLMPDHFEIMLYIPEGSIGLRRTSNNQMQLLSQRIGKALSSYSRAYNRQKRRSGSLFQPKTKSRVLFAGAAECMNLIHTKPVTLGLTFRASEWEFSSMREYVGRRSPICSIQLAKKLRLTS